jgi:hypothetical protein
MQQIPLNRRNSDRLATKTTRWLIFTGITALLLNAFTIQAGNLPTPHSAMRNSTDLADTLVLPTNFDPLDEKTWPVVSPWTPDHNNPGSYNPGQIFSNYADKVKQDVESLIKETEDDIMAGLTQLLENFLMDQLQSLLGSSPLRSMEKLKEMMKEAYSKVQKLGYNELKVAVAEQKSNTELTDNFANYYKNLELKKHAEAVEYSINTSKSLLNERLPGSSGSSVFTAAEQSSLNETLALYGDMSDLIQEIKVVTNNGSESAYMGEGDRMEVLDQTLSRIKTRFGGAERIRKQIQLVARYRIGDINRMKAYDGMVGSEDLQGGGALRVRRVR